MFRVAYMTDVGKKRTNNQDAVYVSSEQQLFIVADGMGGHQAGEVASQSTIDAISEYIENGAAIPVNQLIEESVDSANKTVYLKSLEDESYRGMGTTCSMVIIRDDQIHTGHVGDSRIYFIDDEIKQITTDHTLVEDLVAVGEITREEARNHPKRHVITRAVGTDPSVKLDYSKFELTETKKILICSDGLSEMVNDIELYEMINTHNIDEAVKMLIQLANDRGGSDNISIILIELDEC